jgi:mannose-6-phosphate isomerase-like protein (cupin superfamily)
MRSGFVHLKPWEAVGWHTSGDHEEALVILHGSGEAQIEGRKPMPIGSRMMVYIPPATRHNVQNTGRELLEYVYVVAPTGSH